VGRSGSTSSAPSASSRAFSAGNSARGWKSATCRPNSLSNAEIAKPGTWNTCISCPSPRSSQTAATGELGGIGFLASPSVRSRKADVRSTCGVGSVRCAKRMARQCTPRARPDQTARLNLAVTSLTFAQGRTETIAIEFESQGADIAAPAGGIPVTLGSSNPGCVAVAAPITIPAGVVSTTATLSWGGSPPTPCTATLTASVAGIPQIQVDQATVTVNPAPTLQLSATNARVGSGLLDGTYVVTLAAPAPAGGTVVTLTSANPGLLQLSPTEASVGAGSITVTIGQGNTQGSFFLQGVEEQAGTTSVSATAPGYGSATATNIVVAPAAIEILGLEPATTVLSPNDAFQVRVGVVNVVGTAVSVEQKVRPGHTLLVTVASSNPAVAQVQVNAGTGASGTIEIAAGQTRSAQTVATGASPSIPSAAGRRR
jgi:hypothetical protein